MRLYTGVVEDRMDPLKLGRCKVRVVGLHSEQLAVLPTEDLPWAMPMQTLNSAAISGIGNAPLGPVEGTWVVVAFQDDDTQFPIILGTLGGIPQKEEQLQNADTGTLSLADPSTLRSQVGQNTVRHDKKNNKFKEGSPDPGSPASRNTVKDQIVEGSTHGDAKPANQYTTISKSGLEIIKAEEGLAKKISFGRVEAYPDPATGGAPWTIGYGTTRINGKPVEPGQVISVDEAERIFLDQIRKDFLPGVTSAIRGVVTQSMIDASVSLAYNIGVEGFRRSSICSNLNRGDYKAAANAFLTYNRAGGKVLPGLTKRRQAESQLFLKDGIPGRGKAVEPNNQTVKEEASQSGNVSEEPTPPVGDSDSSGQVSSGTEDSGASQELGFRDPNKKYPLYIEEPDTNRLARHEFIENTVVFSKEAALHKEVKTARDKTWSQSPIPYNTDYPFNKVFETESGHIVEFDDTPEAERIHLYHKSGTFTEIDHNGTRVNRIIGDGYEIYERNGNVYLGGTLNVTIKGDHNVLVENAMNVDIKGETKVRIFNDANISVGGNCKMNVAKNLDIKAENITIEATKEFSVKSGTTTHIESTTAMHLNAGSTGAFSSGSSMNIRSGSTMNVDYSRGNFGQGASSAESAFDADAGEEIEKEEPQSPELGELTVNTRRERAAVHFETEDDSEEAREDFIKSETQKGAIDPTEQRPDAKPEAEEKVPANKVPPKGANCEVIYGMTSFPSSMKISPNFTLGQLTKSGTRPLRDQNGLTAREIACNLKGLCENVLEVVLKTYPGISITSCFRRPGDLPAPYKNEKSQHTAGQAVDFVINGFNRQQHYDAAIKLSQLVPYDQFILEYDGKKTVWIHISFRYTGNRKQLFTMNFHRRVSDYGKLAYIPEA